MAMSLGDKQRKFSILINELESWATKQGYGITLGDGYRDPRVHGKMGIKKGYGHKNSFHKKRLARDINLFKNGKYLTSTESHLALGERWESMDSECTWGGRFPDPDGNHYSYGEKRA